MAHRSFLLAVVLLSLALALTRAPGTASNAASPSSLQHALVSLDRNRGLGKDLSQLLGMDMNLSAQDTPTPTPTATEAPTHTVTPTSTRTQGATPDGYVVYLPLVLRNFFARPATPLPTNTPTPTATLPTSVFDDFSDPNSGWVVEDNEDWSSGYLNGEYQVFVKSSSAGGGALHPYFLCVDCVVEVDARYASSIYNVYGLTFGVTADGESSYMFLVWEEGYYAVYKIIGYEPIVLIDNTAFPGIKRGQDSNHLRVVRQGTDISAYINGEHAITFPDDTLVGLLGVGVVAGSGDIAPVDVRFDNFRASVLTSAHEDTSADTYVHSASHSDLTFLAPLRGSVQARAGPDPVESGPYSVVHVTTMSTNPETDNDLKMDIYYPSSGGAVDPSGAPYPAVLFAPGLLANPSSYPGNCEHLASWGYIVAVPDFPDENIEVRASDVRHLLSYLEAENADGESKFFHQMDTSRFGLAGHSLGGLSTLMVAARDGRIKAAVALDPVNPPSFLAGGDWDDEQEAPSIIAPLAVIGAPAQICNYNANYNDMYPLVGSYHKAKFVLADSSHCDFMDTDNALQRFSCYLLCGGKFSEERMRLNERYTTAWFNYYLRGEAAYYTYIFGAESDEDVQAGHLIRHVQTGPRDVVALGDANAVELQWTLYDHPVVAGYNIYRRQENENYPGIPYAQVGRQSAYVDANVRPGQRYFYVLRSRDLAGNEHQASNEVSAVLAGPFTPTAIPSVTATPTRTPQTPRGSETYLPLVLKTVQHRAGYML